MEAGCGDMVLGGGRGVVDGLRGDVVATCEGLRSRIVRHCMQVDSKHRFSL